MERFANTLVFVVLVVLLGSCAESADSLAGGDASAGADASVRDIPVCGDGNGGFVALQSAGGGLTPGELLLVELGSRYIVVDPSCGFVVYDSGDDYRHGMAVEGQLTDAQAQELTSFLALGEWEDLDATYGRSICDGPSTRFVWGDRILDIIAFCPTSPIAEPPTDFRHDLIRLTSELASRLRPLGEPLAGPVRYLLIRGNQSSAVDSHYRDAPAWPLDAPPESVAVSYQEVINFDFTVQTAEGDEAVRLRRLRAGFLNHEFGSTYGFFVPIEQPDGARFDLFVRDVVEFETPEGEPYVPWIDLGRSAAR